VGLAQSWRLARAAASWSSLSSFGAIPCTASVLRLIEFCCMECRGTQTWTNALVEDWRRRHSRTSPSAPSSLALCSTGSSRTRRRSTRPFSRTGWSPGQAQCPRDHCCCDRIQLLENGVLKIAAQKGFEGPFLDCFNEVHDRQAACGAALRKGGRIVINNVGESDVYESAARKTVERTSLGAPGPPNCSGVYFGCSLCGVKSNA
jgi:hypothetical protein